MSAERKKFCGALVPEAEGSGELAAHEERIGEIAKRAKRQFVLNVIEQKGAFAGHS